MLSYNQADINLKDPFFKIVWIVLILHLLFFFFLAFIANSSETIPSTHKKISVMSIQLTPKEEPRVQTTLAAVEPQVLKKPVAIETAKEPASMQEKKESPSPQQAPSHKSEHKPNQKQPLKQASKQSKATPAKKPVYKTQAKPKAPTKKTEAAQPTKQPQSTPKREQLHDTQRVMLTQALQKMKRVNTEKVSHAVSSGELKAPGAVEELQIDTLAFNSDSSLSIKEIAYRDELAHRLKLLLKLPEFGEVKLKLTIERSGKIAHVNLLHSVSRENKLYIEKTLPNLKMPPFGDNFAKEQNYSFTITLSHK